MAQVAHVEKLDQVNTTSSLPLPAIGATMMSTGFSPDICCVLSWYSSAVHYVLM